MGLWIYLDDIRDPPDINWTVCRTVKEAKKLFIQNEVDFISFDHDLGEGESGYDLAKWMVKNFKYPKLGYTVHSSNPVGATNIKEILEWAKRKGFWINP